MRRLLALAIVLAGCGGEPTGTAVGLDLRMSALTGEELLQFVLLHDSDSNGLEVTCPDAETTCIADQVPRLRVVLLDVDGAMTKSYRVPLDLDAARTPEGQPIEVPGIPPGRGYLLVVEAVRDDGAGEQRVGVGCTPVDEVTPGKNPAIDAPILVRDVGGGCLPRID